MFVSAIIAAGGRGQRIGGALPKQFLAIGGRTILERSVNAFLSHPEINEIVVALPADLVVEPPPYLTGTTKPVRVVPGGPRRQDSVANAFNLVSERSDIVVVHDAARPFTTADLISRTIAAAADSGAAVAAVQASDTIKRTTGDGGPLVVAETLPRASIFLAQTPQAFRRAVLRDALSLSETSPEATDEATLAERAGHVVRVVQGDASNIKVTTPGDLQIAETLARSAGVLPARTGRAGTGYDLHRLVAGRPLILGGVVVASDRGALGHSDADVVCHAITDAILGALGLGDIGRHFPDTDPQWKDASSLDLLARVAALVAEHGYEVGNVDATVVLEAPKIRNHIEAMRTAVAGAVGIDPSRVSIKGKTNEGVDAVGRGEAVAAHAIALLRSRASRQEH